MSRSLLIVGAGPAGMAAAVEAVGLGCRVRLLDEAPAAGGQIYRQRHPSLDGHDHADPAELARKKQLIDRFTKCLPEIDYRPDATAHALFPSGAVHVARGQQTEVLEADAVIVATGVREFGLPIPGWTIPGVMYAGGAQAILKSQGVLPGRNVVVAGAGPLPLVLASQIIRAGGKVEALAPLNVPWPLLRPSLAAWHGRRTLFEGLRYAATIARAGVRRLTGYVPTRVNGGDRITSVVLSKVDRSGHAIPGEVHEIGCDLLAVNYGFTANTELPAMAGARMRYDPRGGGWLPVTDAFGRTSVPNLFVAGDCAGLRGGVVAALDGAVVARAAAAGSSLADRPGMDPELRDILERRRRQEAFQLCVQETLRLPPDLWRVTTDDTTVCRCENVTLGEVRAALQKGHVTLDTVKKNLRTGMGWCQGKNCLHGVANLMQVHAGELPEAMATARPLARPVSLAALAHGGGARVHDRA